MDGKSQSANIEMACHTKYYEHDGMLRAYANRAMVLAFLFGFIALGSLAFAIYVRLQPPTVIRVDKDGNATVVGAARMGSPRLFSLSAQAASEAAPSQLEGRAVVRQFLDDYLIYTPDSAGQNFAAALNMMTANLRSYILAKLRDQDTVGKIQEDHIISDFEIRSIEHVKNTPWTYVVFGVKEVHRLKNGSEVTDRIVGQYNIRLVEGRRSELDPSGLLVAEYSEQEMVGDRNTGLVQHNDLDAAPGTQP
ncbi:MAG TPA: VirB8/TrbF family protein [Terriglobia bacterium]|nr:VirB8/TrbF family protein [Terriglobia bacterium]